jgi:hypothetical protein
LRFDVLVVFIIDGTRLGTRDNAAVAVNPNTRFGFGFSFGCTRRNAMGQHYVSRAIPVSRGKRSSINSGKRK